MVDLVFSDLVMPGTLNGYDLAAKITAEFPCVQCPSDLVAMPVMSLAGASTRSGTPTWIFAQNLYLAVLNLAHQCFTAALWTDWLPLDLERCFTIAWHKVLARLPPHVF